MSGSSQQLTLTKGAPRDQVCNLLCLQLASYLEGGLLMWMMPLHQHVHQKSDYDMIYEATTSVRFYLKYDHFKKDFIALKEVRISKVGNVVMDIIMK